MAVSNIGGGSLGRRRSLDAEINLVPFIDLLSMCICFLLMTAVWSQLNSIPVKQANGTEGAASTAKTLDLDIHLLSNTSVSLTLKGAGKAPRTVQAQGKDAESLLQNLAAQIQFLRGSLKVGEEISAVMVTPKSGVEYGTMVSVMDVLRKNRMVNLGVVPVNPNLSGD